MTSVNKLILKFIIVLIILSFEIVVIYFIYNLLQKQEEELLILKMNIVVKGVLRQTRGRINQIQYTVSRPTTFFTEMGKNVSRSVYHDLLQIEKNPLLTSIETILWLPKIYNYEKESFENYYSSVNDINYTIQEYNTTDKNMYPVEQREFYFPYAYSEPTNSKLDSFFCGFDFYSNTITKKLIDYALSSINSTGSFRTELINKNNNPYSYGIILNELSFLDKNNISVNNIVGIVMAVINVGDIMNITISNIDLMIDRNDLDIMVFDITKDEIMKNQTSNESLLYKEVKSEYENIWFSEDVPNYSYMFKANINIQNRIWNINFRFLNSFINKNKNNMYVYIIIIISLALFLFDTFLYILVYFKNKESEKKKKEIANKMLGYVNHEVRNPLNVINGMIDITIGTLNKNIQNNNDKFIIQKEEIYPIISDLYTAQSSCNMLTHIVNDILDIRKLEENKLEINNEYIELDLFCKNIIKTITPRISEKNELKFFVKIDDDLLNKLIFVDKIRLEQILLNFIFNSIKFTIHGFIELSIKIKNKYLVFEVKDTGRGIHDNSKKIIFQPFRQTKKEDATRYGGIGLGLYLCKMLVTCMGGTIGFNSQFEKGSIFFIEIPLKIKEITNEYTSNISQISHNINQDLVDIHDHSINIKNSKNVPNSKLLLIDLKKYINNNNN